MDPSWQDIVLMVQAIAVAGGVFYYAGQLSANLKALRAITTDHEGRIRELEG